MIKLPLHLVRREGILYFRRAVPCQFLNLLGIREIKLSLRTSDVIAGRIRARLLSSALDVLFGELKKMPLTNAEIVQRAQSYFRGRLSQSLEHALTLPQDEKVDLDAEIAYLQDHQERMKASLARQQFPATVQSDALELLGPTNLKGKIKGSTEFQFACNTIARATLEDARILEAKLCGQYDKVLPLDPWFAGIFALDLPALPGEQASKPEPTLASVADQFFEYKSKNDWAGKTASDVKRVIALAVALIGDRPIRQVNADDVKAVRNALSRLPPNHAKTSANKGASLQEIISGNSKGPFLSIKSQDKYFTMFRQVLIWACNEDLIDKVPGIGVKVAGVSKLAASERRTSYSHEQLTAIFHSPLYTGQNSELQRHKPGLIVIRDGKFWVPLIALFSGLRMGEIVQLLRSDVKHDQGIWYFDINKSEEKSLKTASSKRRVPVHRSLIDLGILQYVEQFSGQARIFPDIEKGKDGYYSHNFSKWWGRYARHINAATSKTTFHSFRHNFADALRAAELPEYTNKSLLGHADKSVHANYGDQLKLAQLKEAVDRVHYQLDLSHLAAKGSIGS